MKKYDAVILGIGYVGLPLAQHATKCGLKVCGFDASKDVVDLLNQGVSHIDDLTDADVQQMLDLGFTATADPSVIASAETVVICVPTPLGEDNGPDLQYVESATKTIAQYLNAGQTIILESTTYPGTTDEFVRPILESTGLEAGIDFHLSFSPERIDPGNPEFGIANTPKIVGGHTEACTESASNFYGQFINQIVRVSGTREAEMVKLLENTYRYVNIAFVNELAQLCQQLGIDFWEVIAGAATKPFGFQAFRPGPGVGGHCIPIDPNYLSFKINHELNTPFRFVELARQINDSMPKYIFNRFEELLKSQGKRIQGASIVLLGVTYKPNISDQRESPAIPLAQLLIDAGANVSYSDPFVDSWAPTGEPLQRFEPGGRLVREADLCALLQNHSVFNLDEIVQQAKLLFDATGVASGPNVVRL